MFDDNLVEIQKAFAEGAGAESVNQFAKLVGNLLPFVGVKRTAIDTYIREIQKSDLAPEYKLIAIANVKKTYKQMSNQISIAKIAQESSKEGTDFSEKSKVDDEWLDRFFDSAKFVSRQDAQLIWGKVLANEFEKPGDTPPQVIRILSEITPSLANVFSNICSLNTQLQLFNPVGHISGVSSALFIQTPKNQNYLNRLGINFNSLNELKTIGLINFDNIAGFINRFTKDTVHKIHLLYGSQTATINDYKSENFPIGNVLLTNAGNFISSFVTKRHIDGHFESTKEFLSKNNVLFSETPEIHTNQKH